jgi:hypothetical protein
MKKEEWFYLLCLYEQGELQEELVIPLFQYLINSGHVWNLQGYHTSMAEMFIDEGCCVFGEESFKSAYGMYYPSRFGLIEGAVGTLSYQSFRGYKYVEL